jgi:hypothetical protein
VTTGKPFRRMTGHLQRVTDLALSGARPLLASAAEDQTVSVWDLRDLDTVSGQIEGLVLADEGGKVVALRVEPKSDAERAGLKVNDVVTALAPAGDKLKPLATALDFALELDQRKPESKVDLEVNRKAVRLPVSRGVEEHKPRFTLFLPREKGAWIGWSPVGYYDASGAAAEAQLGWHTNTGNPAAPVKFAAVGEYREEFYRKGLLAELIAGKDPPPAKEVFPEMLLRLDGARADRLRDDLFVARRKQVEAHVELNPGYRLDPRDVLSWRLVDPKGAAVKIPELEIDGDRSWKADLSGLKWQKGDYVLSLLLESKRLGQTFRRDAVLRYLPAPPALKVKVGGRELTPESVAADRELMVMDPELAVEVKAEAVADADPNLEVSLEQRKAVGDPAAPVVKKGKASVAFGEKLTLAEGNNTLVVLAGPPGALDKGDPDDVSPIVLKVRYRPKPEMLGVDVAIDPDGVLQRLNGKDVLVLDSADAVFRADVAGSSELTALKAAVGKEEPRSLLPKDKTKTAKVAEKLSLKTDSLTRVWLRAEAKNADPVDQTFWVIYLPPLPRLAPLKERLDFLEAEPTLSGRLEPAGGDLNFKLEVVVTKPDGSSASYPAEVKRGADKAATWQARVKLGRGENRVKLRLDNGGRQAESPISRVYFLWAPKIVTIPKEVKVEKSPLVGFTIRVQGPADLPPTAVSVNKRALDRSAWELKAFPKVGDEASWELTLKDVPANSGPDTWFDSLTVTASNDDGESPPVLIKVAPPIVKKPVRPTLVRFPGLPPDLKMSTHEPTLQLQVVVTSETPLKEVRLFRELTQPDGTTGQEELARYGPANVKHVGDEWRLDERPRVDLLAGPNTLYVVYKNADAGEETSRFAHISYVEEPVLVEIDEVRRMDRGAAVGDPLPLGRGERLLAQAAPEGLLLLTGHIWWDDAHAKQLDAFEEVGVEINGGRQFPTALGRRGAAGDPNRRTFQVPVVLTYDRDNEIVIELPGLKAQQGSRKRLTVDCVKPWKEPRLHLLIVGVDVRDPVKLKESWFRVLKAQAPTGLRGPFSTSVFKSGVLYQVLTVDVTKGKVLAQLIDIREKIRELSGKNRAVSDVIIVYFQGRQKFEGQRRFLLTRYNDLDPDSPVEQNAIDCDRLPRIPGVKWVVLNVNRIGKADQELTLPGRLELDYSNLSLDQTGDPAPRFLTSLREAVDRARDGRLGEIVTELKALLKDEKGALRVELPEVLKPLQMRAAAQ